MMRKRYCYSILVFLLFVLLCYPAFAAKCVKPNGNGGCYDNIQDAIDAVAEGGTVQVYPGIYYDKFDVIKPGITIVGMGNKRTDVRIDLLRSGSNGIIAANVTVKNLTIQNGSTGIAIAVGIGTGGDNSKILNVNIFNSEHHGISIDSTQDTLIKNCKILKNGGHGIENISGPRLTVKNTTISDCGENGIFCRGDQLTVDGCIIKDSEDDLINVEASNATIHNNQLFKARRRGIFAVSDFVKVTENLVRETDVAGIHLNGEAPVVKNNTVMHAQSHGFYLYVTGGESKIVNNQSSYNDEAGFFCNSEFFVLFKKNKALNNSTGFYFRGDGDKMIIENQSRYNRINGFFINNHAILKYNVSSENGSRGYTLDSENTATQNKAFNNMTSGFYVISQNNLLRNNKAIGNLENGIDIGAGGDNNDIINNTMLDNLHDKCDESGGSSNNWTGNTYETDCY